MFWHYFWPWLAASTVFNGAVAAASEVLRRRRQRAWDAAYRRECPKVVYRDGDGWYTRPTIGDIDPY